MKNNLKMLLFALPFFLLSCGKKEASPAEVSAITEVIKKNQAALTSADTKALRLTGLGLENSWHVKAVSASTEAADFYPAVQKVEIIDFDGTEATLDVHIYETSTDSLGQDREYISKRTVKKTSDTWRVSINFEDSEYTYLDKKK